MNFFEQLGNFFSNLAEQTTYFSLKGIINLLEQQGQFDEAIQLTEQSLDLARKIWGNEHKNVATTLNNLALLYYKQGKYNLAEPLYQEALAIYKHLFKRDNPDVATTLNNLASLYDNQEKYSEAESLHQDALSMRKRLFKTDHPDIVISLNNLACLYHNQKKYSEAELFAQEVLAMRKRLFRRDHTDVATNLNNLVYLYGIQGKYSEAELFAQESLAMNNRLFKTDHPDVAISLNNLALLYDEQGKYSQAEPLLQEALAIRKRLFTRDHPDVATSSSSLASLYNNQGKYSEAESLLQESLAMRKRLFKTNHPDVALGLNNLALLYDQQGKYSQAEPLYREALAIYQRLFKRDHPHVANNLNNLGCLYNNQGKYSEAKPLFQEALAMRKRLFSGDHPDIATSLNNLAFLYNNQRKYSEAEVLVQEALAMKKRLFKTDHPDVATISNNLACLYDHQGKYSEAESLYQEALAMRKRLFKTDHPDVAASLNNLAFLYKNQGKDSEAKPLYQEALAMYESLFPNGHSFLVISLNNLALLYAKTNCHQEALKLFKKSTEVQHRLMSQEFLGSSENDRMLFLDKIRITQYNLLSLVYKYFYPLEKSPEKSDAIHTALDLVLKRKAISNAADAAFNAAMNSDRYPHLQDSFQTYRSLWKQIVNLQSSLYLPENSSRLEANKKLLEELYVEVETLQKKLSAEVPEMNLENQLVDRQEIASELPENSTLIEFAYFPVYDFTTKEYQAPRYLAFILPAKKSEKVQMIDLGEAEKIDNLISLVRQGISPKNLENMGVVTKKVKLGTSKPSNPFLELATTVFEPLKQYLQGEQLFICPDGKLTLIPFEILPVDGENNHLFIDKYQITYLTAGRDLLRKKNQPERTASESLVIADPNFDLSVEIPPNSLSKEEIPPTPLGKGGLEIPTTSLSKEGLEIPPTPLSKGGLEIPTTSLSKGGLEIPTNSLTKEGLDISPTPLNKGGLEIPTTPQEKTDLSINLNSLKGEIIETFGQGDKKPFLPVPMTREIAEAVAAEFQVKPLLQNDALKTHLTNGKCPKKLVLATHGFFLEQENRNLQLKTMPIIWLLLRQYNCIAGILFLRNFQTPLNQIQTTQNPLWRSGLALAGANTWLFGGEIPPEAESGILFALDVAGLDLWANELIILIACDTALGDVKIGEGVKGLRSAFTAAGARLLIMSLWSVPSQVSILLMNRFFANMQQKNLSTQQALQEAQIYIKTITRTELEALPTGQKIIQQIRERLSKKSAELLRQWEAQNYPLQARYFWGAWVCVGREFEIKS